MKIYLEKAVFVNRAPFDKLDLDFSENEIVVLSAANGKGKTTILSHLVDCFFEMSRPYFPNEFEEKENKLYRVSGSIFNLIQDMPSIVYLRFKTQEEFIDYVDIRNNCTEEQYNEAVTMENKILFNDIESDLKNNNYIKKVSSVFNKEKAIKIFLNNILTYFPSYRYETPGYINDPYKVKLNFKMKNKFSGYLNNPIEVISGLPQLANWIMDVVLDLRLDDNQNGELWSNLNLILTQTLISKKCGNLRFGVGPRGFGATRIQILQNIQNGSVVYPSIFNLSSGETSILCLFGELLRQSDNIKNNIQLDQIMGVVLIDEVDKHLHIKLQKEVLPKLFGLFPNVQFIVSSHSPFLNMGLAEELEKRSKIIDLDNFGISIDPTTNELYLEVYNMIIGQNKRFRELYQSIQNKIEEGSKPLIITEGKTDVQHIKKAKEKLDIYDCDIEFYEIDGDWGESKLKTLLEQLSKVKQARKIIGIFDRDLPKILLDIEKNGQPYKNYGNNVYAFCIPTPPGREAYLNISIEFYYTDEELKKEKDGKRLYFDNEVEQLYNKRTKKNEIRQLPSPDLERENEKKIFCEDIGSEDWIHSKARFAELVESDESFIDDFNFANFNLIFNKIKEINIHLEQEV